MSDQLFRGINKGLTKGITIASGLLSKKDGDNSRKTKARPANETKYFTGLYFRHHSGRFTGLEPFIEFSEPQTSGQSFLSVIKNISSPAGERAFYEGCRYLLLGYRDRAIASFRKSVEKEPQLADGYYMLGILDKGKAKGKAAHDNLYKAVLLHGSLGKTIRKALPSFRLVIPVTSNLSYALYADLVGANILLALVSRSFVSDSSIKNLEHMLDIMPSQSSLLFFLSLLLYERGRRERAISKLKNVLPDSPAASLNLLILCKLLADSGNYSAAIELIRKMLSDEQGLDPELVSDYSSLLEYCKAAAAGEERGSRDILLFERLGIRELSEDSVAAKVMHARKMARRQKGRKDEPAADGVLSLYFGKLDFLCRLDKEEMVIGRGDADVDVYWDEDVAERQARITRKDGIYYLEDLGSSSGTFVNGHKILKKVSFSRGDVLEAGLTKFEVR